MTSDIPFTPERATFQAAMFSSANVAASLESYGCALIKGLFDPAALATFHARIERNLKGTTEMHRSLGAPEGFNAGFPLYFAGTDAKERVHRTLRESYPQTFIPAKMWGMDCYSLTDYVFKRLRTTRLNESMRAFLGVNTLCTSSAICHIRRFDVPEVDITLAEESLEFHQDNRLYGTDAMMLTLWFPFNYMHGEMSSLEFLPFGERKLLPTARGCGIARNAYPKKAFWSPAYELGDAVLISGYSPHRTYFPPGVSQARTSIDVRFFSTPVPEPIFEHVGPLKAIDVMARRAYRAVKRYARDVRGDHP